MSRTKLFEENIEWAIKIARKLRKESGWPIALLDEIQNAALFGLWQASKRHDKDKGSFNSFAYARIRGSILDQLRMGCWFKSAEKRAKANGNPLPGSVSRVGLYLADDSCKLDQRFNDIDLKDEVLNALRFVPERYRVILWRYFIEHVKLKDIGKEIGVSESRACQLMKEAVRGEFK